MPSRRGNKKKKGVRRVPTWAINWLVPLLVVSFAVFVALRSPFPPDLSTPSAPANTGAGDPSREMYEMGVLHEARGPYGRLLVVENYERGYRLLMVGSCVVGGYWLPNQTDAIFTFSEKLAGLALGSHANSAPEGPRSLLQLGIGTGQLASDVQYITGGRTQTEGVELFPDVTAAARRFFGFEGRVHVDDAAAFLLDRAAGDSGSQWGAIVVDTWLGTSADAHAFAKEVFTAASSLLKPKGVFVINMYGFYEAQPAADTDVKMAVQAAQAVYSTLQTVFPTVRVFRDAPGVYPCNIMFAAIRGGAEGLAAQAKRYESDDVTSIFEERQRARPGRVITSSDGVEGSIDAVTFGEWQRASYAEYYRSLRQDLFPELQFVLAAAEEHH